MSWALYDWANSAFATTVMAGFFPLFFKEYWSHSVAATQSTYALGLANSVASAGVAITAPLLGAIADQGFGKKNFLIFFTIMGALSTMALSQVGLGEWQTAAVLFALGNFAFACAISFYDALLIDVADESEMDRVSSYGYAMGYLGGGLLFLINVLMYLKPRWFGLESGTDGVKASFVTVGVWWLIFTLPLLFWVREKYKPRTRPPMFELWRKGWLDFWASLRRIFRYRPLLIFLLSYLIYIDGVNTIIKMAVDYGMAIGFKPSDLITALLLVQFVGFPSAIAFGRVAEKVGARQAVFICLWIYALITLFAFFMQESWHFYLLAALVGLVQGGVQALSRSIYGRMIPAQEAGEFFGIFNLMGKFSAIAGPLLVGWVSVTTGEPRWSILVILAFILGGGLLLRRVDPNYKVPT